MSRQGRTLLRTLALISGGALPALLVACSSPESPSTPVTAATAAAETTAPMTPSSKIPLEDVAHYPLPGTNIPVKLQFSPDDAWLTFLWSEDGSLTRSLYGFEIASRERKRLGDPPQAGITEDNLTLEQRLQRERMRERGLGVTRYAWAEHGQRMIVPLAQGVYAQDGVLAQPRALRTEDEGAPWLDPMLSPAGDKLAFVTDNAVQVLDIASGTRRTLSKPSEPGVVHGLAEYIAQEEMRRQHGMFWSRDGKQLAFTEVDERHLPQYRIDHLGSETREHEQHAYPFAGSDNAKVRLAVVSSAGGKVVWMDLEHTELAANSPEGHYLARVDWMPDGSLFVQLENREQTRLDLLRFDPASGRGTLVLSETSDTWINLHDMLHPLEHGKGELEGGFVWSSERSGFAHLYLYDGKGRLVRPLTEGSWQVDELVDVDEDGQRIFFLANENDPRERHLYVVGFSGGKPKRLTEEPGIHSVVIDHAFSRFADTLHSRGQPPRVELKHLADGQRITTVFADEDPRIERLALKPPELVTLKSRDGTTLYGALYRPHGSPKPLPTLVSVYGGPHKQVVENGWGLTVDLRAQYLASLGYLVLKLDNRGSARRGLAFESKIKHDLGNIEVQDQVDGVRWLVAQKLTDPERVGIYGWSYGGYVAAMALARAPETFKAAVAGAPVTHWDGYDTHYTERYMGTPKTNPEGYARSSVMAHVKDMRGRLMFVHGLIDENVHFRHTARLINALIQARKHYDLLLFPNERHMPRALADRVYMEQRVADFFAEHL